MFVAIPVLALGCHASSKEPPAADACHDPSKPGCVVTSEKPRIENPAVPDSDMAELSADNTTFALNLYQELRAAPGNLFYSPYSISSALAMSYAGARTETERQIAAALHFTLPQDRLHPAFNALDQELARRGGDVLGLDSKGFRLKVANALWGQAGTSFEKPFLDVLAENYGAGMRVVDFAKAAEEARQEINRWVADTTENKIQEIVPRGVLTPSTRLVLTNAIYFHAAWEIPFKEANTAPGQFSLKDGTSASVPMMSGSLRTSYAEGADYAAVELPYEGNELSMVLIRPSDIDAFEAALDKAHLDAVLGALGARTVNITMPKFRFDASLDLARPLQDLGMPIAFSDTADFSGISAEGHLAIGGVVHKAFISVDEAGTEAAASTAVIISPTSVPQVVEMKLDRPFLFLIRDLKTDAVLFLGRVSDPR